MGIYWDIWVEQLPSFDLIVQAAQVVINMRFFAYVPVTRGDMSQHGGSDL